MTRYINGHVGYAIQFGPNVPEAFKKKFGEDPEEFAVMGL